MVDARDSKGTILSVKSIAFDLSTKHTTIKGTGVKNGYVTVYIFSAPFVVTIKTDSDGNWQYSVDKELENGTHEIYVAMTQGSGQIFLTSTPIPFVKTANAATFGLTPDAQTAQQGFFQSKIIVVSVLVLIGLLGISLIVLSLMLKRDVPREDEPPK